MQARWILTLSVAVLATACGGVVDVAQPMASTDREPPAAVSALQVDADGRPTVAQAPADAGARTRAGRYASAEQAAALEAQLGDRAIRVDVGCCDATEADMAVMMAFVSQAAHDLPNAAPVLVHGADLRMAAVVADRLGDAGLSRVWLVVQ